MKLKTVLSSKDALIELSGKDVSISISYTISKLLKEFDTLDELYRTKLQGLYDELGNVSEKDDTITEIPAENVEEFHSRVEDIQNEEVLEDMATINIATLIESNIDIKPSTLISLSWLIKEDE